MKQFAVLLILFPAILIAEDVKAKLGIELKRGTISSKAHAREVVRSGDRITAYVLPAQNSNVYVVSIKDGKASLINGKGIALSSSEAVAIPSMETPITLAGSGLVEIQIYVSREPITDLNELANGVALSRFREIERRIKDRAGITGAPEKPAPVAANVRAMGADVIAREMPGYSSPKIILAKFYFDVQN